MKKHILALLSIVLLIFTNCSQIKDKHVTTKTDASISIVINENLTMLIDDQEVDFESFPQELENRVNELRRSGASEEDIVVTLKVDKKVKMGAVTDLVDELRKLSIHKLKYSTI